MITKGDACAAVRAALEKSFSERIAEIIQGRSGVHDPLTARVLEEIEQQHGGPIRVMIDRALRDILQAQREWLLGTLRARRDDLCKLRDRQACERDVAAVNCLQSQIGEVGEVIDRLVREDD